MNSHRSLDARDLEGAKQAVESFVLDRQPDEAITAKRRPEDGTKWPRRCGQEQDGALKTRCQASALRAPARPDLRNPGIRDRRQKRFSFVP